MLPLASVRAFLQSINPALVISRSLPTEAAVISTIIQLGSSLRYQVQMRRRPLNGASGIHQQIAKPVRELRPERAQELAAEPVRRRAAFLFPVLERWSLRSCGG